MTQETALRTESPPTLTLIRSVKKTDRLRVALPLILAIAVLLIAATVFRSGWANFAAIGLILLIAPYAFVASVLAGRETLRIELSSEEFKAKCIFKKDAFLRRGDVTCIRLGSQEIGFTSIWFELADGTVRGVDDLDSGIADPVIEFIRGNWNVLLVDERNRS